MELLKITERDNKRQISRLVLTAFALAADGDDCEIISIDEVAYSLKEVLFEDISSDIEEFFSDLGYNIEISSPDEITSEIMEEAGIKIDRISTETIAEIFEAEKICFKLRSGQIVNHPLEAFLSLKKPSEK